MLTFEGLADLTDPVTLSRGRAYARQSRVEALHSARGELRAEVVGSETYHVRVGEASWSCDCPVGVTGALCKHCVAVVVAAETAVTSGTGDASYEKAPADAGSTDAGPEDAGPADAWLERLDPAALRALLRDAVAEIPGVADLVARAYISDADDVVALRAQVEDVLKPRRQFYEYGQANRYAADAEPVIRLLADRAARPSAELLDVIERAIALTVRTILRSDDSSGAQGDQVRRLLDLHADVAGRIAGSLDTKARRRLARWLHTFVFSGKQDFFEIDVDRYAGALGDGGVAEYRNVLEQTAHSRSEGDFAVRYARGRLAVLDRDAEAIVAVVGEGLHTQYHVLRVVESLDDAGLHELAVEHAARGLTLAHSPQEGALVQRLVDEAAARGDTDRALALRREAFLRDPSSVTLAAYRAAAEVTGVWGIEREAAEQRFAAARPWEWIAVLLRAGRDGEAWAFAVAHPDAASSQWELLCARRAATHPAETVPYYRRIIAETLATTGRGSYVTAARLLVRLRAVCTAAGTPSEFHELMAATAEANRRRPTCINEFVRAGLIRPDRSVVGSGTGAGTGSG